MKTWDQFISEKLALDSDVLQMIREHEKYREEGFVGECLLRTNAAEWLKNINSDSCVSTWMAYIAHDCYKHFAKKWIADKF
jgi:hypothetical protein